MLINPVSFTYSAFNKVAVNRFFVMLFRYAYQKLPVWNIGMRVDQIQDFEWIYKKWWTFIKQFPDIFFTAQPLIFSEGKSVDLQCRIFETVFKSGLRTFSRLRAERTLLLFVLSFVGNRKFFSSFCPSVCYNSPSANSFHSAAKSMFILSFSVWGLKCPFHCYSLY